MGNVWPTGSGHGNPDHSWRDGLLESQRDKPTADVCSSPSQWTLEQAVGALPLGPAGCSALLCAPGNACSSSFFSSLLLSVLPLRLSLGNGSDRMWNVSLGLLCLHSRSPVGSAVLRRYETLRRRDPTEGSGSLGSELWRLSQARFLCTPCPNCLFESTSHLTLPRPWLPYSGGLTPLKQPK